MKIRTCFVSNSSSSSCVCDICGRSETGWDMSARDAEMFTCVHGHTVCLEEAVMDFDEYIESLQGKEENETEIETSDLYYEAPEALCPICSMLEFSKADLARYLKKKTGISREEAFEVVKAANRRRKKLYEGEYVMYALTKTGGKMEDLVTEIKTKCPTYTDFLKEME